MKPLGRQLALTLVFALVVGGITHASHFHKEDFGQRGETHLDCSLCTFMAGAAGPPDALILGHLAAPDFYPPFLTDPAPPRLAVASYEPRGPP